MRILGPVMILGANVLIAGIVYAFLWHIVPDLCGGNYMHFLAHVLVGFYLLGNVIFNYVACISTSPGYPEPCHDPIRYLGGRTSVSAEGKRLLHFNHQVLLEPGVSYRWCRHCKCIKPPRAHHDSVSGRCVLDMDHYWCVCRVPCIAAAPSVRPLPRENANQPSFSLSFFLSLSLAAASFSAPCPAARG